MRKHVFILLLLSFLINTDIHSQGCSDAGVCTIHSIKSNSMQKPGIAEEKNELGIGTGYAKGERGTDIFTVQLEYSYHFKNDLSITGKVNYNSISGELGKTKGPGDLFLSAEKSFGENKKWRKNIFAGIKIPLGNSDKKKAGMGLPMVYQPTLGTTDLLAGISFIQKQWAIAVA